MRTIKDLVDFTGEPEQRHVKTLMYFADGQLVAVILRGDRELNEIKLKNVLGCNQLFMADDDSVRSACGAGFGSLGPVGMDIKIYADQEIAGLRNFTCGANEDDYHYINVNPGRDFLPEDYVDIRNAVEGDLCPVCGHPLKAARGIEVGHIFKLGTKYSQAMNATVLDKNGQSVHIVMGCYGIGISRTMAAAVEQNHDENGIIWPIPITPFQVIIIPINVKKQEQMEAALSLYNELQELGLEVLLDDRDERAGVKFKDADLIGIPLRIVIGPKALQENQVEMKKRWENEIYNIAIDQVAGTIMNILKEG